MVSCIFDTHIILTQDVHVFFQSLSQYWKNLDAKNERTEAKVRRYQEQRLHDGEGTMYESNSAAKYFSQLDQEVRAIFRIWCVFFLQYTPDASFVHTTTGSGKGAGLQIRTLTP